MAGSPQEQYVIFGLGTPSWERRIPFLDLETFFLGTAILDSPCRFFRPPSQRTALIGVSIMGVE